MPGTEPPPIMALHMLQCARGLVHMYNKYLLVENLLFSPQGET